MEPFGTWRPGGGCPGIIPELLGMDCCPPCCPMAPRMRGLGTPPTGTEWEGMMPWAPGPDMLALVVALLQSRWPRRRRGAPLLMMPAGGGVGKESGRGETGEQTCRGADQ